MNLLMGPIAPYMTAIKIGLAAVAMIGSLGAGFYAGHRWDEGTIAGLKDQLHQTQANLNQAHLNERTLTAGLVKANASIAALKAAGDAQEAKLQTELSALASRSKPIQTARVRLSRTIAAKGVCPTVNNVLEGAFQ
jgi:hypothetical protein